VKGIEWNYLEKGSGKSLLYIHGNTGCSVWWEKVMDVPGYRVIAPDMPNFGLSSPLPGKPGIEAYADAMARSVAE
jgi:branched-chain amino acid transport system permease protein